MSGILADEGQVEPSMKKPRRAPHYWTWPDLAQDAKVCHRCGLKVTRVELLANETPADDCPGSPLPEPPMT